MSFEGGYWFEIIFNLAIFCVGLFVGWLIYAKSNEKWWKRNAQNKQEQEVKNG